MKATDFPVVHEARQAVRGQLAWFNMMMRRKHSLRGRREVAPMRAVTMAAAAAAHSLEFFDQMMAQKEAR